MEKMIKVGGNKDNFQIFFNKIVLNLIENKPNLINTPFKILQH